MIHLARSSAMLAPSVLLALSVLGGCGRDDSGAEDSPDELTTITAATTSTQPPTTDLDAVRRIVEDLLARLDYVTDRIVQEPSLVLEDNAPVLEELADVHAAGEAYDARLRTYERNAEEGTRLEPLNADQTLRTTLTAEVAVIDRDLVEGRLCIINSYRAFDGSGALRQVVDGVAHPGRVTAVRENGTWKIQQIDVDDTQLCDPEATA